MADLVRISKLLSLVLRHEPAAIGITLDANGWADVGELIAKANATKSVGLTPELVHEVVRSSDKQRFALSDDGMRIRANQGHSIDIDLELVASAPPADLYHGTAAKTLAAIREAGLLKMARQHVHLSFDVATATKVGARHGKPVVLTIRAGEMAATGFTFFCSDNGVWLTEHVPARYIGFPT